MSKKLTKQQFIEESIKAHGNKYDYSLVEYKNTEEKVKIICPVHGVFEQSPKKHKKGQGCPKCTKGRKNKTFEEFVKEANQVHNNKYNYFNDCWLNVTEKIKIICPVHGEFYQTPHAHLRGQGCPKCSNEKKGKYQSKTTEEFIKKAKEIHGDKYDYSSVNYIKNKTKIEIICPAHGSFWQTPSSHLNYSGCPKCKESHGEQLIRNYLLSKQIAFESQKKFKNLKDKQMLSYDFYIPKINLLIEYNGKQHYYKIKTWGGRKQFLIRKHHDWLKRKYAKDNGFSLLTISYKEHDKIEEILNEELKNLTKIKP